MAVSSDNCGRTFSNVEVAAEGLTTGSLYGIRAGCPPSNIFEFCDGTLPAGSRSYETLKHGGSSKTKMYDGDQDFDQLPDMEFVFGGKNVGVGSILDHLNHSETFPTGPATHSGENGGMVFPRNFMESKVLGQVYDNSSGVGGMCDDLAAAEVLPGFMPGNWNPKVGSLQGDVPSSHVNFPCSTTQDVKSDLPTSCCRKREPETTNAETGDFDLDWSAFSAIDPLHRFSHINGPKSNKGEGRWFHSRPSFDSTRLTEPFSTSESAFMPVRESSDNLRLSSQNEHNKPQISTTVPHIFAQKVPSSGSAEPSMVSCPPANSKLENDLDLLEPCECSGENISKNLPPVATTSASISVESFNRGLKCTSKDQTSASDEGDTSDTRRDGLSCSSRSQPVLDRRKSPETKPFFDPRRIFAAASKPRQTTSQRKPTIEQNRTSDCARNTETKKKSDETPSNKASDGARSKEMQKGMAEKIASKTSDGARITETLKKSDEKTSTLSSNDCILNNDKSQAQSHTSHTLDRSQFIKNDLSDLWKQKSSGFRVDSGRGVHDQSSEQEQEQEPARLRETQGTEGVEDEQPTLRKVENTLAEVSGERQDSRSDKDSTKLSLYLQKIIKEKIFCFAVWAFCEILPIVLNVLKLVIGIIFHEFFSISCQICRITWQGLLWFCQWLKQRTFPSRDDSTQEEPKKHRWHDPGNQSVPGARAHGNRFLSENITLPESGDEAIRRLFSCEGKDPYSILGLKVDCTDEEIRKYYRRQAVLVHPDKNSEPGAEEAFKILNHAFELIGEPDKRQAYNSQTAFEHEEDVAMQQFTDLLTKLHEAMQESMKYMGCSCCGGKHKRIPVDRPAREARYCIQCDRRHSAKEGDVWAESSRLGFLWRYYACMEGQIYDVTEWASCQQDELRHIPANSHHVLIHISTGRSRQQRAAARDAESELKDLLESMCGTASGGSDTSGQFGRGSASDANNGWKQGNTSKRRKRRRR